MIGKILLLLLWLVITRLKVCFPAVRWALLVGLLPVVLEARTWTEAGSGRTIKGELVEVDGAKAIIKLEAGRTVSVSIARLIEADRRFIRSQHPSSAAGESGRARGDKETGSTAGVLRRLTPPVSVTAHPIKGHGEEREAVLEVTNNGNRNISTLILNMYFLKDGGQVAKRVPHTSSENFGGPRGSLGRGKSHPVKVNSFFMDDETASVNGEVIRVEWDDGTSWPTWPGPAPEHKGDAPVVAKMVGVIGEGEMLEPVVAVFNTSSRGVKNVNYSIAYLGAAGKVIGHAGYGYARPGNWLPAGQGTAICGASSGPPEGTLDARVTIREVIFENDTRWKPPKK